jgi:hypothetical protein
MDNYMNENVRRNFSSVAFGFGIASMVCALLVKLFAGFAIQLGCTSIFMGFISKGYYYKRDSKAKLGLIFALVGIAVAIFSFAILTYALSPIYPSAGSLQASEDFKIIDAIFGDFCMEEFGLKASEIMKYIMSYGGLVNVY